MTIPRTHYEELLADYSSTQGAIALLKQYRPYLEMIPSMRRPGESVIAIPLPVVKLRRSSSSGTSSIAAAASETMQLPCDVAMLMCDPEWKIKTGAEIFVFIHRSHEDFSDLLGRWRQTQVSLSQGYEWEMPLRYRHILSEGAETTYPLFVVYGETPERITRGLRGAFLPVVTVNFGSETSESTPSASTPGEPLTSKAIATEAVLKPSALNASESSTDQLKISEPETDASGIDLWSDSREDTLS